MGGTNKWFFDKINDNLTQMHAIEGTLYNGQTKFQSIEIMQSPAFGKMLVIDNKIQSSTFDEFIYHEILVQPLMIAHPNPEKVFIAGGGEGATIREIIANPTVKKCIQCDIDKGVIDISRKYLPEYSQGAYDEKRTVLKYADARKLLADSKEKFDVIIIDLTEPAEEGPSYKLYTTEFYSMVADHLTDYGLISMQAGSTSYVELTNIRAVARTLETIFPIVKPYQADIPSFGGPWGFLVASMKTDPTKLSRQEVDKRIKARGLKHLKFYDGITHEQMFAFPKHMRKALATGGRVITDDKPLYLYKG
jgi:spermidine synthase